MAFSRYLVKYYETPPPPWMVSVFVPLPAISLPSHNPLDLYLMVLPFSVSISISLSSLKFISARYFSQMLVALC